MKYIINKTLVFNTDEQTISLYENHQIVTRLTKPAGRLLLELIQNGKQIVTREELLAKVWTSYGFSASNAGLNNYISELRKTFILLGCHRELIVTLPKKGFRFEADILLVESTEAKPLVTASENEGTISLPVSNHQEELNLSNNNIESKFKSFISKKAIFAYTIFIAFIFGVLFLYHDKNDEHYPYQQIASIENCVVYFVGKINDLPDSEKDISLLLKREDIDCNHDKNDIFYMENRLDKKSLVSNLISVCRKERNNRYDTCFNIKYQRNTTK